MFASLKQIDLDTSHGRKAALVIEPRRHVRLDSARLSELERADCLPAFDQEVVDLVERAGVDDAVLVMRAQSDDRKGSWSFDEGLSEPEALELAYRLARAQLPTYRRLIRHGVVAVAYVELRRRAVESLRTGAKRVLYDLDSSGGSATIVEQFDRWILRHLTFFYALPCEKVLTGVLPAQLAIIEERLPQLHQLVSALAAREEAK